MMMRTYEPRPWSGPALALALALPLALVGCPGGGSSDAGDTESNATESEGTPTGTGSATSGTTNDPTSAMTSGMTSTGSTGSTGGTDGSGCNPPCADGEVCMDGLCFGNDETALPPPECNTNFTTEDPACDECWQANCCDALQACHGDDTVMGTTPCGELDVCINESCTEAMDLMSLQMCVDENCPELSDQVNTWFGLTLCAFNSCDEICNPPMG